MNMHSSSEINEYLATWSGARVGESEAAAIERVLQAGETFGYGNMMGWLATAWAEKLRDDHDLSDAAAIDAVSNRGPYPLRPRKVKGGR